VPDLPVKLSPTSFSAKCMIPALNTFNSSARATGTSDSRTATIEATVVTGVRWSKPSDDRPYPLQCHLRAPRGRPGAARRSVGRWRR
jgi:hypothetical protein